MEAQRLHFSQDLIRKAAIQRLGKGTLPKIFLRQAIAEWGFRLGKKMTFRKSENAQATSAYRAMEIREFEGINARQQWSNWRTIPRSINGLLTGEPITALDLCCGTGQSTEVLAYYLPEQSTILGLEFNPEFLKQAGQRNYRSMKGRSMTARFRAQSVLEPFRDEAGLLLRSGSVDLVNSSGAIGVHFRPEELGVLAHEVWRVLKPGGLASIDAGIIGPKRQSIIGAFTEAGFTAIRRSRSCALDPYVQVCFRKAT